MILIGSRDVKAAFSNVPDLDAAEHDISWSLVHVATKHPNLTGVVATVICAGDVLLVDVQVDGSATRNDGKRVDLVQTGPDEGRGAFL